MSICLYIDPANCRRWQWDLLDMMREGGHGPVAIAFSTAYPLSKRINWHYRIEKSLFLADKEVGGDAFDQKDWLDHCRDLAISANKGEGEFDLVIDLVGDGKQPRGREEITLLFNGHPGDKALIGSIIGHGMPQIALRDKDGHIVATAVPSAELAIALPGSMDQTYARVITLLRAWLANQDRWAEPLVEKAANSPGLAELAGFTVAALARKAMMSVYAALFRPNHWRVGWRWVEQQDAWSQRSLSGDPWQILPDRNNHSYADPTPCTWQGRQFLFFEDLDTQSRKGVISVIEFDEDGPIGEPQVCLREEYHLSYPFLWEQDGEILMIPETSNNGDVAIYRAKNFPFGWERQAVIMSGIDAADITLTRHDGKYWIFCVTRDGDNGYSDCLSIFYADDLHGPWQPHAQNPVLINAATARPAGKFYHEEGRLFRPVQNCSHHYGAEVSLVEVTHLSQTDYRQQTIATLTPDRNWPGRKLHTLNRSGKLEVIDGAILRPRWQPFLNLFNRLYAPASD